VATRTLTQRELNRALLARQLLLERASVPLPRALERIGEIQAQYAPSMYIGLWTRLQGFERDALTRALERRSVVQGTLMRTTIHLVPRADYWPIALAIREARRENWLKARRGMSAAKLSAAAKKLRGKLKGTTMSRKEIDQLLGGGSVLTNGVGLWLDLVRVPPSGTWEQRRADLYAMAEDWVGPVQGKRADGVELLVRRYLSGFGPASRKEIANWAGLHPKAIEPAVKKLKLRIFEAEDGEELLDLPRAPLPAPETPAPARFLPVWDATLLVHARRTGILPEEHRSKVFNARAPQSVNTFLVEGAVAGTWREEKGRIKLSPFGRLDAGAHRELEAEAESLAGLHA
jgi:DNA glycosylase AlkZ-like